MADIFQTPILLTIFNRPDLSARLWTEIRKIKPSILYVAADGPRTGNKNDERLCEKTRQIITQGINWNCNLKLLFRKKNLGCGRAMSSAITWFFKNVSEGIILEDDCLPHPDFFPYCNKLLERYRNEDRIFMISGNGVSDNYGQKIKTDYIFTQIPSAWGWATWRRSWEKYDFRLNKLESFKQYGNIEKIFSKIDYQKYWLNYFNEIKYDGLNNWDYQLAFAAFKSKGLCIRPRYNLVSNLGIQAGNGTIKSAVPKTGLKINNFPNKIEADKQADEMIMHLLISPTYKLKTILKRLGLFYFFKKLYKRL